MAIQEAEDALKGGDKAIDGAAARLTSHWPCGPKMYSAQAADKRLESAGEDRSSTDDAVDVI